MRVLNRAASYSLSAFLGAATLLLPVSLTPRTPALGLVVPLVLLFVLGFYLGRSTAGNPIVWSAGIMIAGLLVVVVGRVFPA